MYYIDRPIILSSIPIDQIERKVKECHYTDPFLLHLLGLQSYICFNQTILQNRTFLFNVFISNGLIGLCFGHIILIYFG